MEMMELNEAWMDADDEAAKQEVLTKVKNIENEISDHLSPITNEW